MRGTYHCCGCEVSCILKALDPPPDLEDLPEGILIEPQFCVMQKDRKPHWVQLKKEAI